MLSSFSVFCLRWPVRSGKFFVRCITALTETKEETVGLAGYLAVNLSILRFLAVQEQRFFFLAPLVITSFQSIYFIGVHHE